MLHLLSRSFFLLTLFISITAVAEDIHLDSWLPYPALKQKCGSW